MFSVSEIASSHRSLGSYFRLLSSWRDERYYTRERGEQRVPSEQRKSNSWIRASGDHESTGADDIERK